MCHRLCGADILSAESVARPKMADNMSATLSVQNEPLIRS
jgi:hypothetical protein